MDLDGLIDRLRKQGFWGPNWSILMFHSGSGGSSTQATISVAVLGGVILTRNRRNEIAELSRLTCCSTTTNSARRSRHSGVESGCDQNRSEMARMMPQSCTHWFAISHAGVSGQRNVLRTLTRSYISLRPDDCWALSGSIANLPYSASHENFRPAKG